VGCGGVDWIELARDMDRWRELVKAVINQTFGFHKMQGSIKCREFLDELKTG
jgi:hypothetical protein